jgi:Mo-co oxidoreductase dimerisation domain
MKTMRSWWYGAAAGCAFVVVELLGRVLRTVPTLPELIQDRLVLLLPGPIFSLLLDRFLYLGKPLLFATLLLGQVAFGGLAGMAIGRWGRPAAAGAALWLLTGLVVLPGTGTYGMKNPKWLTRIELVRAAAPGFWQQQGWDEQGIIQTMSQIVSPGDGDRIPKSAITIAGIAFAGARGIDRVEITTDSGATWNEAQILPSLGPNTWTFWQHDWQPPQAGSFVIAVRAADSSGTPQTPRRTDPFPSGATGYHQVRLRVSA